MTWVVCRWAESRRADATTAVMGSRLVGRCDVARLTSRAARFGVGAGGHRIPSAGASAGDASWMQLSNLAAANSA